MSESVQPPTRGDRLSLFRSKALLATVLALASSVAYLRYDLPLRPFEKTIQAPPRTLPPAVRREQAGAIQVWNSGIEGSGVKIAANLALTAGHIVLNNNVENPPACGEQLQVATKYTSSNSETGAVVGAWSTRYVSRTESGPDVALIKVASNRSFDRLPVTPIATTTPHQGEKVYFVNYQESPTGLDRYPSQFEYSVPQKGSGPVYDYPAEYAGVVVGNIGSKLEIATSLQGYGPRPARVKDSYHGASGGPVEDEQGALVGIVEADGHKRAQFIDDWHLLHLPVANSAEIGLSIVQPVTPAMVSAYEQHFNEIPPC